MGSPRFILRCEIRQKLPLQICNLSSCLHSGRIAGSGLVVLLVQVGMANAEGRHQRAGQATTCSKQEVEDDVTRLRADGVTSRGEINYMHYFST